MTIGEKIYEMRTERNMSLREFANATGLTHTTIARIESPTLGPQKVFLDTIFQICKKLHYDFGQFLIETNYLKDSEVISARTVMTSNEDFSYKERELIENYRKLNASGKNLIDQTFNTLLNKSTEIEKKKV